MPFFIMLCYIAFCGTRADIIGDNIYYLGFLLTLVSLAYTLYKFTSADAEIDQIIKNFGIALSTTLIGVVGRVYFNQTHLESDDDENSVGNVLEQEQMLQIRLNERAGNLITQIDVLSSELMELKKKTIDHVQETTEQSLAQFSIRLQTMSEQFSQRMTQDLHAQMTLNEAFSTKLSNSNLALEDFAASVRQSSEAIHSDITQSRQYYEQYIGEIAQESSRALSALTTLKNSLAQLGGLWRSNRSSNQE